MHFQIHPQSLDPAHIQFNGLDNVRMVTALDDCHTYSVTAHFRLH